MAKEKKWFRLSECDCGGVRLEMAMVSLHLTQAMVSDLLDGLRKVHADGSSYDPSKHLVDVGIRH
ncbi:MAG: hypothetical protein R3A11_05995 [Bdellovibrionota bacterium]